jgi:hypothetical protein
VDVLLAREVTLARVVGHDHHVLLADAVAAHELSQSTFSCKVMQSVPVVS